MEFYKRDQFFFCYVIKSAGETVRKVLLSVIWNLLLIEISLSQIRNRTVNARKYVRCARTFYFYWLLLETLQLLGNIASRIFGCIPEGCVFLLLCVVNVSIVKFTELILWYRNLMNNGQMDRGNENPTQHLPWWLRKTAKKPQSGWSALVFEPGTSRMRVSCITTEPPRSVQGSYLMFPKHYCETCNNPPYLRQVTSLILNWQILSFKFFVILELNAANNTFFIFNFVSNNIIYSASSFGSVHNGDICHCLAGYALSPRIIPPSIGCLPVTVYDGCGSVAFI